MDPILKNLSGPGPEKFCMGNTKTGVGSINEQNKSENLQRIIQNFDSNDTALSKEKTEYLGG